ncbi:MAG: glycoside hydrolase family 2 TIM barrel-domain containing protein [Paludibacter sp.]
MKKHILFVVLLFIIGTTAVLSAQKSESTAFTLPSTSIREEICLNGMWDFTSNATKQKTSLQVPACYDNSWGGKWGKVYWDAFGFPRNWSKGAVYEKELAFPNSFKGKNVRLKMYGCLQTHTVEFDGKAFPTVYDGYVPHVYDLCKATGDNSRKLRVLISDEKTRLSGGESMASKGINDDVFLYAVNNQFVEEGMYIRTSFQDKKIAFDFSVRNTEKKPTKVVVKSFITDKSGNVVKEIDCGTRTIAADTVSKFSISENWNDAHLWFPHDPYLYHLTTVVYAPNGKPIDSYKERFGFREITWNGPVLYINGRKLFLRGHGEHYLGDLLSSRAYYTTWLTELKKLGVNFMRLHVYPRPHELYRVADEVGFLFEAEPCFHFLVPDDQEFAKQHLGDMMRGLINHPSIVMWSVSNELRWRGGGEKPWLVKHAQSIDNTRPAFSSDFSEFSVAGDLVGHHYNTESVWKDWEKCAPNKPIIWDECGEIWQLNRPLGNGTAGFEVSSQDVTTGLYRDGNDEVKKAMDLIREGSTFSGKFHRINAVIPWDLGYVFFRWQPFNRYRGVELNYPTLEGVGMKQRQVLPCSSPLNIWDPTLPVFEPNPGYYLFEEDMKWVRFNLESKNYCFFGGNTETISTPLFIYDDLRYADQVSCRVETTDGKVLSESVQKINFQPGDLVRDVKWTFDMPKVGSPTEVRFVRQFIYQSEKGYADVRQGKLMPRFSTSTIASTTQKIGVVDSEGKLTELLKKAAVNFVTLTGKVKATDASVLLVVGEKPANADELMNAGVKIICFAKSENKTTQNAAQNNAQTSARLLLNGAPYRLLKGISQSELTYWRGGNITNGMPVLSDSKLNQRVIISGDKDGKTSALTQYYGGKGTMWQTSLRIIESLGIEPTADVLLSNLLNEALNYKPVATAHLAVFGSADFAKFVTACAPAEVLKNLTDTKLKTVDRLCVDARNLSLSADECRALSAFAEAGGKLFFYQSEQASLETLRKVVSPDLELTEPYIGEKTNCIKAATSWTLRTSPATPVEYYDGVVIPQSFEPNFDPFLSGLSNISLNWDGNALFSKGIARKGVSPVMADAKFKILLSNWRNDWSIPPFGGEYINEGKDMRQALWYLNRNAVWASTQMGKGEALFCQIQLLEGAEKGAQLFRHLLTQWECSLSSKPTYFPAQTDLFDLTPAADQQTRLAQVEKQLAALTPMKKIPDVLFDKGSGEKQSLRRLLLLVDSKMEPLVQDVIKDLNGFANASYSTIRPDSPDDLLANFEKATSGSKWDIIYFSFGYGGVKDLSAPSLAEFDKKVMQIIQRMKSAKPLLMWCSQPPVPDALVGSGLTNDQIKQLNIRVRAMMEQNSILVNDTYGFIVSKTPEYLKQDENALTGKSVFFKDFTPKLQKSIVEAIKFFGN